MNDRIVTLEDLHWQERYQDMVSTPEQAVSKVRPGQRVFVGSGCAQPEDLVRSLVKRHRDLADIEIVHLLTMGEAPYADPKMVQAFRVNTFFIADNVRDVVQKGLGDYTPISLHDIPRLFQSGRLPLDVALVHVSTPDINGLCSLGVSVDIVKSAIENAALVIAQVNPQMPRTLGDSFVSVHDMDVLVPVDVAILEVRSEEINDISKRIGENVAALVEDGATIQIGIGEVPQAVLNNLHDRQDLGIHTEMFTDSLLALVQSGAVTGNKKTTDKGKVVTSFCMGTKRLYDEIDRNSVYAFHPTEYVNDPGLIAKMERMVSINTALEVDLTGQVCADSLGSMFFSGIGGQTNFNFGAGRAPGGKAIIALPSTTGDEKISRIVTRLSPGAGVVTTRGEVHYVVTEYGVAYLHGKSVQERVLALISIAHPKFREQLLREAIEVKFIRSELADVEGKIHVGPQDLGTTMLLEDGTQVSFRPVHPTDEQRIRDLFYGLSRESVYSRWMSHLKRIPREEIHNYVYIDHRAQVAIVGTLPEAYGDEIIAVGGYFLHPKTNRAEVAFLVRDKWQRKKIGSFLLKYLIQIARRNGIAGFTAEVLRENRPMQMVFNNSDCKVESRLEEGVYFFELDFE